MMCGSEPEQGSDAVSEFFAELRRALRGQTPLALT
jgi:hypothetical protein